MIGQEQNGLKYYQFESLRTSGIFHGIFTRLGGESPGPWNSLNIGGTVGDSLENTSTNLDKILNVSGTSRENISQVWQIHSSKVILADSPMDAELQGDAMISNQGGLYLLMRFADCVPILFYDHKTNAIGIAHAGWKGTVKEVGAQVVLRMGDIFGSKPEDLVVGIGPSIGPDHYTIGKDVLGDLKNTFPDQWREMINTDSNEVKLDLWKTNEISLRNAGVRSIEQSNICTGCNTKEWYSHRAEEGKTGRFAAIIGLKT
jgi:YfiH family protein